MDPKRAMVLKHYNKLNQSLFNYRKLIKNIKITIIRRAYIAYSKMQKDRYLAPKKFVIMSKAFRSTGNLDLRRQLKAIETAENGSNECLPPKSMNCQNSIKSNVFKVFEMCMILFLVIDPFTTSGPPGGPKEQFSNGNISINICFQTY